MRHSLAVTGFGSSQLTPRNGLRAASGADALQRSVRQTEQDGHRRFQSEAGGICLQPSQPRSALQAACRDILSTCCYLSSYRRIGCPDSPASTCHSRPEQAWKMSLRHIGSRSRPSVNTRVICNQECASADESTIRWMRSYSYYALYTHVSRSEVVPPPIVSLRSRLKRF